MLRVQIDVQPQLGTANISEDALLKYMPKLEFLSGGDFLSLNLLNAQGSVLDTDSIHIQMMQSTDSLPCENGALTDYYQTARNQVLLFWYLFQNTSNALFTALEYQRLIGKGPQFQYQDQTYYLMKPSQCLVEIGLRKNLYDSKAGTFMLCLESAIRLAGLQSRE